MRDSRSWKRDLERSLSFPGEISRRFGIDPEPLSRVVDRYPMRITPYYLSLMERVGDPLWLQAVPDPRELEDDQSPDPLDEENLSPVPGLIHRYPDRVVWLVGCDCAVYCRFCMRKRRVGRACSPIPDLEGGFSYLEKSPQVRDVILSGGDPLLLDDDLIDGILSRLRSIPHVEIIRIGSRAPVTLPSRITPTLCQILKKYHPLYLNTHFNHPREITPQSVEACRMLADAGIPLGNQTVLLKGVNDDTMTLRDLFTALLRLRVRPYYLHQMDLVKGTAYFRTPVETGLSVIRTLRGFCSGLAVPHFVIDLPGGKGKVPLLPNRVERKADRLLLESYRGEMVEYRDIG
ncbi:MAG: KamA family radical SAM protein [Desulfuromonadia bacterium]